MEGWSTATLGDVCDIYQPKTISKKEMAPGGKYPVFGANGIIGRYDQYNHEEPQLLITCRGATCGSVNVSQPQSWITGNAMVIRPTTDDLDQRFVEYFFRGGIDISLVVTGAAQPQITRTSLAPVPIAYPPLPEQKRIVAILDEAFAAIATATANAEKNLANAREVFESQLNTVFAERGSEWPKEPLGQVCENLDSMRVPITKAKRTPGVIPYYGASGVVDHVAEFIFDEDLLLVSEDGANLLARTYPIAFSISGRTWVNNHAHVLRFQEMCSQRFTEYYLNSIPLSPYVNGMAQPKLNQKALNSIPVPFPDIKLQEAAVATLDGLADESQTLKSVYQRKLELLTELKQSILHKAFTGELTADTKAADRALSEAV